MGQAGVIQRQLNLQSVTIGIILSKVRSLLETWQASIVTQLELDPAILDADWWRNYATTEMVPQLEEAFTSAVLESVRHSGFAVSFTRVNPYVRQLAKDMAFELVNLDNPKGIVYPRVGFLDAVKDELATGVLPWADLEERLGAMFGEYRARLIARTETTTLWARSHSLAAEQAGMVYKRNVRAELGRRCPTRVCPDAEAEGWIPLHDDFASSGTQGPAFHPHCYCFLQFMAEEPE